MRNILLGVGLSLALWPLAARAATEENFNARTTQDLVALCSADPKEPMGTAALNFCHGFAQGAVSVEMEHDAARPAGKLFCFPTPVPSRTATLGEFVQWAQASPSRLSQRPADGLFAFLAERFPCSSTKK